MRPANRLTIFYAHPRKSLTKAFGADGAKISDYDNVSRVYAVETRKAKTLKQIESLLIELQDVRNACVLRGEYDGKGKRRKNKYFADAPRKWLMIDIDKLKLPKGQPSQVDDPENAARYARSQLPKEFHGVACVWQASSSAGLKAKRSINLHLWFLLSHACTSKALRDWLTDQPWIDPSVFRAVQPHYTAAPILECDDPFANVARVGLLEGPIPRVNVPLHVDPLAETLEPLETQTLSPRPPKLRDVSEQALRAAKRRAASRAKQLLAESTIAYQDAYTCGCVIGYWLAIKSWNDQENGHNLANDVGHEYASSWGAAFKALPRTSQSVDVYTMRVMQGIAWAFARGRADLEEKQAETIERLGQINAFEVLARSEQRKQLKALAENPTQTQLEICGRRLGAYTGADEPLLERKRVITCMAQDSGLSAASCDEALRLGEAEPINLDAWRAGMKYLGKTGELAANEHNLTLLLVKHPMMRGALRYNVRSMQFELTRRTEWSAPGAISADASAALIQWLGTQGMKDATSKLIFTCLKAIRAQIDNYDPFIEYLNVPSKAEARRELAAMGPSKLDSWLVDTFDAKGDRQYLAAVGRKFLISAVARAFEPGAQVDSILVLVGDEGLRKTSVARSLGGVIAGGFRNLHGIAGKDDLMQLQGPIILEAGEMHAFQGRSAEQAKLFVTKTSDSFRAPYGYEIEDHPRRCVLLGTTNELEFLSGGGDAHRRFWPVVCRQQARPLDPGYVAELWREAALRYVLGERWWLSAEEEALHAEVVRRHKQRDVWEELVYRRLDKSRRHTLRDVLRAIDPEGRQTMGDQHRASRALRAQGWTCRHTELGNVWVAPA